MAAKFETKIRKARFVVSPYTAQEMIRYGQVVIDSNLARWDRAVDANDGVAPPLRPRYAAFKSKRYGSTLRDLKLTGRLRRSLKVLTASVYRATMGPMDGIHTRSQKRRSLTFGDVLAILNRRWRMWGVSPLDQTTVVHKMMERPIIQAKNVAA
jgi:hypothetical protein